MNEFKLESDACAAQARISQNVDNQLGLATEMYHVVFVDGVEIDVQGRSFEHASLEALALYPDTDIHLLELARPVSFQSGRHH